MERLTYRGENGKPYVRADGYYQHCRMNLDIVAERLAAYEDAEEQGLLVRLPCKVGDTMYYLKGGYYKPKNLCEVSEPCTVREISIKTVKGRLNYGFILSNGSRYSFNSIGKTVFLFREEAEAALKED